ncbi:ABC transporter permease [Hujiaoplasma nucleasis]|uniref:ABC transporter permease n=1 Tax=Hujiaoplasma nucleasis TaxID=2725268 RepID=A0A7L6N3Z3_9MOLU|nr:ABC transporter permease [Hujiaoplasma nucleasis]QLY39938.1 ABC transporter permease [Hujiaoplasma nucleasis]
MADNEKNIKKVEQDFDKSQFQFVQKEDKIYDKKFQTKPIGYFKDAMIRFVRNKTNVVATTILALLILLSVVIPALDPKADPIQNDQIDSQISYLPPRIPLLDKLGIADGTASYEDNPASYANPYIDLDGFYIDAQGNFILDDQGNPIDAIMNEDGTYQFNPHPDILYLPTGEISEFIEKGTLTNYYVPCTDREVTCEGGFVQFSKQKTGTPVGAYTSVLTDGIDGEGNPTQTYQIQTLTGIWFPSEVKIELDITESHPLNENIIDKSAAFKVYFQIQQQNVPTSELAMVLVFDSSDETMYDSYDPETGLFTVDIANHPELTFGTQKYRVVIAYESNTLDSGVLDSFKISALSGGNPLGDQGPESNYLVYAEGFPLSQFRLATDILVTRNEVSTYMFEGNILRIDGQRLTAAYTVDAYARAFGPVYREGHPGSEFLAETQGCTLEDGTLFDPEVHKADVRFNDDCAIYQLIQRNDDDAVVVPGKGTFYTYNVYLNYRVYAGYDELPYYFFGTSAAGYDMFNLIWIGLKTSLLIGLFVSIINIAIGVVYGAISGYYGGQVDIIMQRFAEIVGRIPWLVTLSIFMAYFEAGFTSLILILIVSGWIGVSSVTRTQFYRYKGREYVLASRTLGAKDGRLIFRHILPNGIGTIITSSILLIPTVIFSEATLSYLGFGIGHGQKLTLFGIDKLTLSGVSIGVLLNDGRNKLQNYPHLTIFPAIIISILMITFNMFGNALRDAFNPALRGSE